MVQQPFYFKKVTRFHVDEWNLNWCHSLLPFWEVWSNRRVGCVVINVMSPAVESSLPAAPLAPGMSLLSKMLKGAGFFFFFFFDRTDWASYIQYTSHQSWIQLCKFCSARWSACLICQCWSSLRCKVCQISFFSFQVYSQGPCLRKPV